MPCRAELLASRGHDHDHVVPRLRRVLVLAAVALPREWRSPPAYRCSAWRRPPGRRGNVAQSASPVPAGACPARATTVGSTAANASVMHGDAWAAAVAVPRPPCVAGALLACATVLSDSRHLHRWSCPRRLPSLAGRRQSARPMPAASRWGLCGGSGAGLPCATGRSMRADVLRWPPPGRRPRTGRILDALGRHTCAGPPSLASIPPSCTE